MVAMIAVAEAVEADFFDEVFLLAGLILHLESDFLLRSVLLCTFGHIVALDCMRVKVL